MLSTLSVVALLVAFVAASQNTSKDWCAEFPCDDNAAGCVSLPNLSGPMGRYCLGCKYGYDGDGETCLEIDGCLVNPCDANSLGCVDVPASELGFSGGYLPEPSSGSGSGSGSGDLGSGSGSGSGSGMPTTFAPKPTSALLPPNARQCLPCKPGYSGDGVTCVADSTVSTRASTTVMTTTTVMTSTTASMTTRTTTATTTATATTKATTVSTTSATWGDWTAFSACDATCGASYKTRSRVCKGTGCTGAAVETVLCYVPPCASTILTFHEVSFDATFGNPPRSDLIENFKTSFLNQLSSTGFNIGLLETVTVKKHVSARRDAAGVVVHITYAPEARGALQAAVGDSFTMDINGQTFAAEVSHSATTGSTSDSNTGLIVGVTIGVIAGVALIVVLVFVVIKNRPSTTQVEYMVQQNSKSKILPVDSDAPKAARPSLSIHNPSYEYTV